MSCNVIKEYADFSKENINKYYELIMDKYYNKDLVKLFLDKYIDIRYYDLDTDKYSRNITKINKRLSEIYDTIEEDKLTAKFIHIMFGIIFYLDDVLELGNRDNLIKLINQIRIEKLGINDPEFIPNFTTILEEDINRKKMFIDTLQCKEFPVEYNYIYEQDLYNVEILYDIPIPKLYSRYAIEKAFNDGIVAEDKLFVEYYMVNTKILKDAINGDYNNKYLLEFNSNILKKKDKLANLLNIFDNDLAKDLLSLKINYSNFISNKEKVYELIRDGYKFSVIIDNKYENYEKVDINTFDVFEYIILNNKDIEKYKEFKEFDNIISS